MPSVDAVTARAYASPREPAPMIRNRGHTVAGAIDPILSADTDCGAQNEAVGQLAQSKDSEQQTHPLSKDRVIGRDGIYLLKHKALINGIGAIG